jgi:predicted Zn-dependent peptidase
LAWGIALLALLLCARPSLAQDTTSLELSSYQLENGLQVILVEDHSVPTVAVDVWYRVGGANDPPGRSGFAHLFEHMMFQGSANVPPRAHGDLISRSGGNANATTRRDITNYFQELPSHQLPLALWLEADRMQSLVVDESNFNREREVVKEEYRQRIQNRPYGEAYLLLETLPFAYPPYQQPVIGSIEDLDRATVEEVRAFHTAYYKPNNATLTVAGDIDPALTRELIQRYFGDIPRREPPPGLPPYEPGRTVTASTVRLEDDLARVPATFVGYVIPPLGEPDSYRADLLAYLLGTGDSSRLARALVDTGLASYAGATVLGNRGPSLFAVILVPNPGVDVEELVRIYEGELRQIQADGVRADELEKSVNQVRAGKIDGLQTALGLAESVQAANYYLGDPAAYLGELERYRSVTSTDIQRFIGEYLAQDDRQVIAVVPGSGGAR